MDFSNYLIRIALFFPLLSFGNSDMNQLPLGGMGRGTSVTLTRDIEFPANQNFIDLPTRSYDGPRTEQHIGYGIHVDQWVRYTHTCRLYLKEKTLDRRLLVKGTTLELSGDYREYEMDSKNHVVVQELEVEKPNQILAFACGGYAENMRGLMSEPGRKVSGPYGPVLINALDFSRLLSDVAELKPASPVVIETN